MAETLTSQSKKFIADLMPTHPIYIPLLPESAQEAIGEVHVNTRPALVVLEKEGFDFRGMVDIFDGGPTVHCATNEIRSIKNSRGGTVSAIETNPVGTERQLICNARLDFRACLGEISWDGDQATIDEATSLSLELKVGDKLRSVGL